MMWRSVGLAIALSAIGPAQESPPPDGQALYKELQGKIDASLPITANMTFESVDAKDVKTISYKARLHVRLKEGWVYMETQEVGKEGPPNCNVLDGNRYVMGWPKGGGGQRMDVKPVFKALWNHQWQFDRERRKVLVDPDPPKDFDGYVAGLRFVLHLQLELANDEAAFKFALGTSEKGGATWLQVVRGTGKVAATPDIVTVTETNPSRTTVIDRRTGFLRSLRLDMASGNRKIVTISDVVVKAAHPDVVFPEIWKDRPGRVSDALKLIASMLRAQATYTMSELLERWPEAGAADRAEALRNFFAWIAAECDALHREAARIGGAANFVKKAAERGISPDQQSRDIDVQARSFADEARAAERDSRLESHFAELLTRFRKELEKAVADAPGSDDARKILTTRLQEGFEPSRMKKAVPSLGAPDYARLLREAIDAAREGGAK